MIDRITSTLQEQPDLSRLWSDPRPLVVLMALRQAGGPLYASQIARQLGAHQETVTKKLRSLRAMGMVTRPGVRSGWYRSARRGWCSAGWRRPTRSGARCAIPRGWSTGDCSGGMNRSSATGSRRKNTCHPHTWRQLAG
jgi:DNA-binding transcriptional ArsR family regulator